ncbi:MAG: translocation/assembly module TamB [Paludibacteraceae bacterium]|nr:translocation/assembly module TamB [Paludibacteraceae bacterium]
MSIEHVDMRFFNEITLENVYIEDLEGDTLLSTDELHGHISLFALFHKEIYITTLELNTPQFNLKVKKDGSTNLDFITQLIPKSNKEPMLFRVDNIEIIDGGFKLHTEQPLNPKNKAAFKGNDIAITKLNTVIRLNKFLKTDIIGKIKNLSFEEQSGFVVSNIATEFQITDSTCVVPSLAISLPNSELIFDTISLKYDHLSDLSKNINALKVKTKLLPSNIYCPDLQAFLPELGNLRRKTIVSCELLGHLDNIKANSLNLHYGSDIVFDGDFEFSGLPKLSETFVYARLNEISFTTTSLQDLIANITQKPFVLPAEFRNFGRCKYSGNIAGFFSNMVLFGQLTTGVGNVSTDISLELSNNMQDLHLNGQVRSQRLQLGRITPAQSGLGDVAFNVKTQLQVGKNKPLKSSADLTIASLTYRNYTYNNIKVKGDYTNKTFIGDVDINDTNGQLTFGGQIDLNANSYLFNFDANVKKFRPYALNLTTKNPNLEVSFNINSEFAGPNVDHMNGQIVIDSILLANNKQEYYVEDFIIRSNSASNNGKVKTLSIESPILVGMVSGDYTIGSLITSFKNTAANYFPVIGTQTTIKQPTRNNLQLAFELESTQKLASVLDMPWFTTKTSTISGHYNDSQNELKLDIHVPTLTNKRNFVLEDISLALNNQNKQINCLLHAQTKTKSNDTISLNLDLKGVNDSLKAYLSWDNTLPTISQSGEILVNTHFVSIDNRVNAHIQFLPTQLVIQNAIWDMAASDITTNFKEFTVNDFNLESDDQLIHIDGKASKSIDDLLAVDLHNIDLEFISGLLLRNAAIEFGGKTTGQVNLTRLFDKPIIEADVSISDFLFNRAYWGNVHATSNFDNINKKINFGGVVLADNRDTTAVIDGGFYLGKDSLDLKGKAKRLDLRFLDYYLSSVLQNVRGYGSGDIHVYGNTRKNTITVTADALAEEAQASIDFLKTTYFFHDSIHVTPTEIKLKNITVLDTEGNKGKLNGYITHQYFKDLKYRIELDCNKMKVLNTTKKDNSTFYGTAYATGKAIIAGTEQKTNITVRGTTEKNSKLIIPFGSSVATENAFITFVDHRAPTTTKEKEVKPVVESENEISLNLMVDVNPNAEIQLLVDQQAGDVIKARGDGNLRMDYNTKNEEFKMYGNYEIEQGSYLFTFQNALRKDFKVTQGGTINWNGDPFNPTVNLRAIYQVNASLLDVLEKSILESSNRTTVPVQCILNLTGNIMSPNIKFDLNLPNSEEELNRALQAVVNTDEMMNRQIIYLLVLGKFFTPESMKSTTAGIINQNDLLAVASSTLSTQLNNWASQMFDNWNFGVNFRSTGEGNERSNEYEFNFLYTPNNRITFNGNVGYRDDNLSASKFIGDFDFEYTLIQSGKLSAKAYTHTNDYKEFKSALTTQGIGLVYRESFNSLAELWDSWKSSTADSKKEREAKKREREEKAALKEEEKEKGK